MVTAEPDPAAAGRRGGVAHTKSDPAELELEPEARDGGVRGAEAGPSLDAVGVRREAEPSSGWVLLPIPLLKGVILDTAGDTTLGPPDNCNPATEEGVELVFMTGVLEAARVAPLEELPPVGVEWLIYDSVAFI